MSRTTWVKRDAQGNVVTSTEVKSSSGCSSCLWVLLGLLVVAGPAAWAGDGEIPVAVAAVMYLVEAVIVVAALVHHLSGRRTGG
jgi:hypothetical protein